MIFFVCLFCRFFKSSVVGSTRGRWVGLIIKINSVREKEEISRDKARGRPAFFLFKNGKRKGHAGMV